MTVFDQAKTVTALQAAERYANVQGRRYGHRLRVLCPLHNENTPSCDFYDNGSFYCNGCKAGGTSIDFVMKLFHVDNKAAARKICEDFGLTIPTGNATVKQSNRPRRKDIDSAISWLYAQTVRYRKWCDYALASLTENDSEETLATFLREREKTQRLEDTILEATQKQDEKQLEQLLINYVEQTKEHEIQCDIWDRAHDEAVDSYQKDYHTGESDSGVIA